MMRRRRGRIGGVLPLLGGVAIVVWALSLGLGCAAPIVNLREGPREYVATDYDTVLRHWTRTETVFSISELERALTVTATYESWDFRWAYVIRYADDYRLTIAQRQDLLERRLEETRKTHEFFVALYGGYRRHNDLTKAESAWIVRLIDSTGNETAPKEIIALTKPNALERRYYPYNSVWRQAFRIRFAAESPSGRPAISPTSEWVGLRFAGAKGNTDLIWELEQPASPDEEGEPGEQAAK